MTPKRKGVDVVVDSVKVSYGTRVVLRNIGVTFQKGQVTAILGASGSGKSTLLSVLAGELQPDRGRVVFRDGERLLVDKPVIAHVRQGAPELIDTMSVAHQVMLPLIARGVRYKRAREQARFELMGLGLEAACLDRLPHQLSGGQRQRVALARARAMGAQIILADEPTANLDSVTARAVFQLLRAEAKAGRNVIVVTHDALLAEIADRVLCCVDGGLVPASSDSSIRSTRNRRPTCSISFGSRRIMQGSALGRSSPLSRSRWYRP